MKRNLFKQLAACAIALAMTALGAQAQPSITGEISFSGGATLNGPLGSATAFTSVFGPLGPGLDVPVVNSGATGSYANVPVGTPVSFTPFTFNPAPASTFQLWSFVDGGSTYSFDVTSVSIAYQLPNFLNIEGTGVAYITGFAPTAGTWGITDTGSTGSVFTFGNVVIVPEPSAAALIPLFLLLGSIGLAIRRLGRRR
jgi:hypothetical protein